MRYIILLSLPEHDLTFFEQLVHVTPNLNRLSVYFDDLLEIIQYPQHDLCQILQKQIYQLEIHLDYSWSSPCIRRDIPKILRIFSNIKSLTITFHSSQRSFIKTTAELLKQLFKYSTNLLCINLDGISSIGSETLLKQDEIQQIQSCLKNSFHIELNLTSINIWL